MKQYDITGMSCAACSARVERAAGKVKGVTSCAVNLLTNSMSLDGNYDENEVISAVTGAGYGISPRCGGNASKREEGKARAAGSGDSLAEKETARLGKRLSASLVFLIALMYLSMGGMIGLPRPEILNNPMVLALAQCFLASVVMIICRSFFIRGFAGLIRGAPNMDTLVALGSGAAFVYSTAVIFAMAANRGAANELVHDLYYESAAMILALITVGKLLEARAKGKTTSAIRSLMAMMPNTVTLIRDGLEVTVPAEQAAVGEIFILRPGDSVPLDGIVTGGVSAVNEAAVTGESIPVDKAVGSRVYSGTVNLNGVMTCEITHIGEDTTLSKIIKAVNEASSTKAPIARIADKVSGIFVPAVMLIAAVTAAVWLLLGYDVGFALARGISVLVISCPCALGLATPVAIMVGSGVGAKNGILFKTAAALETAGRIKAVVFDKTGTVTSGKPIVTDIIPTAGTDENMLLTYAASLEKGSEHPLGRAVIEAAEERGIALLKTEHFTALAGSGVSAELDGRRLVGGNYQHIFKTASSYKSEACVKNDLLASAELADTLSAQGKTPLFFSLDGNLIGIIAVSDSIRDDSREAIAELHRMKIKTVLLTGDSKRAADAVAGEVGIDEVYAEVKPEGKLHIIEGLALKGKTAMVGDGINDAPALTRADLGIAIGAGTDIAIDSADAVLTGESLFGVCSAVKLGRETLKIIHQNLFWAFFYNTLGIPIAAGVFIPIFGIELSPMLGALAMSLSSFCVVSNALRLNLVKLFAKQKCSENNEIKEVKQMEKVLKVSGMMCPHCEAHVKKALESLDGVSSALPSHKDGRVVITLTEQLDDSVLKTAIEDAGYTVL